MVDIRGKRRRLDAEPLVDAPERRVVALGDDGQVRASECRGGDTGSPLELARLVEAAPERDHL